MRSGSGRTARDVFTGRVVRVEIGADGSTRVTPASAAPGTPGPLGLIAPAFWDIQTNGRWGRSYSDPALTVDEVVAIVRAQAGMGTARLCPTLITAPFDAMQHGAATIASACEADPAVARMVVGLHLEGPSISELDGYRGAHPASAVRGPDWDELQRLQDASCGRVVLVTLAPERPGSIAFIERATASGIAIAIGHTAADPATIDAAVRAGARLSTHLGNGIAGTLPRHPNPIWTQAADDRLWASLIADGHHLDRDVLRVLLRAKGPGRCLLVSDASPLAGLPPGVYGPWEVDPSGRVVVAGTPYLAGSNRGLGFAVNEALASARELSLADVLAMATTGPAALLGLRPPELDAPNSCFVLGRFEAREFTIEGTSVDGRWVGAGGGFDLA